MKIMGRKALFHFILTFALLGGLVAAILLTFYQYSISQKKTLFLEKEKHTLETLHQLSLTYFSRLHSDIHLLGNMKFSATDKTDIKEKQAFFLNFAHSKRIYDQVRYLDILGHEIIRVNYDGKKADLTPEAELQNKADRYYFKETIKLPPHTVYTSPLDLNIEHGQLEIPYKPMLRLAIRVTDKNNQPSGIIILNFLAGHYLQELENVRNLSMGDLSLINSSGQFIFHKNPSKQWSFMFPNRPLEGIFKDDPDVWLNMLYTDANQMETTQGIYTFNRIVPFGNHHDTVEKNLLEQKRYWTLYTRIPTATLAAATTLTTKTFNIITVTLVVVLLFISLHIATLLNRRRYYRARLQELAHYDSLTGLVNRVLLRDHMETAVLNMRRYGHRGALLYLDLDGFKPVNDNFGHETGDELLKAVGRRLKSMCRATDTVSRVGGDEFIILLPNVDGISGAEILARKVVKQLNIPFTIRHHKIIIGTSIGIAMMSKDSPDIEALITEADQAMYQAKKSGKNGYRFSADIEKQRKPSNVISLHKKDH